MSERLAAAEAALKAGRSPEAVEHLTAAIGADPAQPVQVYRVLVMHLYQLGRFAEGEAWSAKAVERFPREFDLWNIRGVLLRQMKRYPEALAALETASKIQPSHVAPAVNRGNIYLDINEPAKAEAIFAKLARVDPRNSEYQRQLGRALVKLHKHDQALVRLRQAVTLKKDNVDAWLDLAGVMNEQHRRAEADELIDKALALNPGNARLMEARAIVIRRSGKLRETEAYLQSLLPEHENASWLHFQLGTVISDYDRDRGNVHMRRAIELEPTKLDYQMALIESLERTRSGDEGANIEESYQLGLRALAVGVERLTPNHTKVLSETFGRVGAFDDIARLGSFKKLGREWAESGRHTALLKQLPRVQTMDDRFELLEQHRLWGRGVMAQTKNAAIRRPEPRPAGSKIRLGFMSSDLRRHPVAYFAQPLFDHLDRDRFEVFCYSYFQGQADTLQERIASQVTAFRWIPDASAKEAAQIIADDQLDMLIELGGSTHMNKLDVMAFHAAPRQASWLGYPHSAGLSTIDYLLVDPYLVPEPRELMIEQPLMMPSSWIALGKLAFPESHVIDPVPPHARRGFVTFGTANNSYKYSPEMLAVWARVVASVPDSHFMFVRPEGGAPTFRQNMLSYFEAAGVAPDRVEFVSVRGIHIPHYNNIDIALDTFPQTGGTTTCEALWMGVPTVSLVGPALFERLSYSILMNAGLSDLCVRTADEFVERAVALAADRARIAELRVTLRDRLKASPLGQTETFARDFYDMIARGVREDARAEPELSAQTR